MDFTNLESQLVLFVGIVIVDGDDLLDVVLRDPAGKILVGRHQAARGGLLANVRLSAI